MGNAMDKLRKAGEAVEGLTRGLWEKTKRPVAPPASELERRKAEKDAFLGLVAARLTGSSMQEMPPLACDPDAAEQAVFLVTIPISYGRFQLSHSTYRFLAKHVGMSLESVSHWALVVITRGLGSSYCYDLMSDRLELTMLGRNYFRVNEVTSDFIATWSSCYYVGETVKSHEEIEALGYDHMALHPRYHLIDSNCQHLVEDLVRKLCDGKAISQAKLSEELSAASPRIARDLVVARLRTKLDALHEREDSDGVKEDVENIKTLHRVATEREMASKPDTSVRKS